MNVVIRYLKRALLIITLLVTVVTVATVIYVRTESFGRLLKTQLAGFLATSFRGRITLGQIETSIWGTLAIHELRIENRGSTIVYIPQVQLGYALIPLLWREARLEVTAIEPMIHLERSGNGEWNLMDALASRSPPTASSSPAIFTVYLHKLSIRNGTIDVAPQGSNGPHYRLERTGLDGSLAIKPAGIEGRMMGLRTRITAPGMPPADLYSDLAYSDAKGPPQLTVDKLFLKTQASTVSVAGVIRNLQTLDSTVAITVDRLAAADLSSLVRTEPLREDVSGRINLKGTAAAMHSTVSLMAGSARLEANLEGDLTRKVPTFDGVLTLTRLNLGTLALPQKLGGVLDVSIQARGEGAQLQTLVARTRISGEHLKVGSADAGKLGMTVEVENGDVQFNGRLNNGPGHLDIGGNADFTGNSRYRILLRTDHFDAARVLSSAPPSDLNSQLVLQGTGSNLQTMDGRIDFRATRSIVGRIPMAAAIQARIEAGTIDISRGQILSEDTLVSFKGSTGISPGARTQLAYQVRASHIAPWLRLAGTTGDGRLNVDGTAVGTLRGPKGAVLRAQGKMGFQSVHITNLSLGNGSATYNFEGIGEKRWPWGDAEAQFTALQANGMKLRSVATHLRIDRGQPSRIRMAMEFRDDKNNAGGLAATAVYLPNQIVGSLDRLFLPLSDGTWRLQHAANFTKDQHHVSIQHFALANGARQLTLDASFAPAGAQAVALHARAVDLAILKPLMPQGQQIAGDFSTDMIVGGTPAAPSIEAHLGVNRLVMNDQRLGDLNAAARYMPSSAVLDATLNQDRDHQLKLNGQIPINLNWTRGFAATIGNNENIQIHSAGIRLAPFGAFAQQTLKNVAGLLLVDLKLDGPPFHPAINGTIAIRGGNADIVPVGVTVTNVEIRLLASPANIQIAQLSAKAGDGSLSGSGSIALQDNYSPGAINATLWIHQWPAIATQQYNAIINGTIHASGTPDAPHVQGEIDVVDTTVHPDLNFLTASSVSPPDNTIVVIQPGKRISPASDTGSSRASQASSSQASNQAFNNLAMEVKINIRRNTWIRHEHAEVELDGGVDVKKRPGGPVVLIGEINTVRGWLDFQGKRFTLASGHIRFTGGSEIDPTLNIDAQYAVSNYTIDLIVTGTASKPALKLQSQPQLAQGDILSLILFGTTTSQLGQGQKTTLLQQAQSIATGAAGQAISQSLGLESLGVNVSGQSVGLGRYLNENTYVSVSPNLVNTNNGIPSPVASIQYFLRRWLTITTATMSDGSRQVFLNVTKQY
jgi:autotransporter translocation and assembly factor TamB